MAEAAVEDRPVRFFCHKCSVEFVTAAADYTCPHCSGGFIEELETPANQDDEFYTEGGYRSQRLTNMLGEIRDLTDFLNFMGGQISTSSPSTSPPLPSRNTRQRGQRDTEPARRRRYGFHIPGSRIGRSRMIPRVGGGTIRPSFENLITDVVLNLTGQGNWANLPGANQMFIVGNPADYAWGREGLDAIVTQLLNQMDGTGPPPMPKDRISEIPTVPVTEEQVKAKLQCSVCWEDFQLGESVRSLPCLHVYHEACICPWLELHATCPICRKSLTEEAAEAATNNSNPVSNGLAALFRQQNQHAHQHHSHHQPHQQSPVPGNIDADDYVDLNRTVDLRTIEEFRQTQTPLSSISPIDSNGGLDESNTSNDVNRFAAEDESDAGPSRSGSEPNNSWTAANNQLNITINSTDESNNRGNIRPSNSNAPYVSGSSRRTGANSEYTPLDIMDIELDMDIDFD